MWDQVSSFVLFKKDNLATAVPNFSGSEKNGAAFDLQLVLRAATGQPSAAQGGAGPRKTGGGELGLGWVLRAEGWVVEGRPWVTVAMGHSPVLSLRFSWVEIPDGDLDFFSGAVA